MPLSSVVGASSILRPGVCTSTSRPASPFEGQTIYETDTDVMLVWNGSAWRPFAEVGSSVNGNVIQVASTTKTDTFTVSLASGATSAITGLTATITPASTSSKILILANVFGRNANQNGFQASIARGTTLLNQGNAAGSRARVAGAALVDSLNHLGSVSLMFLDSPNTTSATTYGVYVTNADAGTRTVYVNQSETDTDNVAFVRTSSVITVMEISG